MTYDSWKLASPPEYEEDAPPAQPQCYCCEGRSEWMCNACGGEFCGNCIAFMYHDCPTLTESQDEPLN